MKPLPPKEMAQRLLATHGPIDKEGKSHALAIVRRYTKPEYTDENGNFVRKNEGAVYWQNVEREMLATVGRKYKRPKTEEEKRKSRALQAQRKLKKMEAKKRKKKEKGNGTPKNKANRKVREGQVSASQ